MLSGKAIHLVPLKQKHLLSLMTLRNSEKTYPFLTSALPVNEAVQVEWFKKVSLDRTKMYFAIEDKNNTFIGFVRCDEWDRENGSIRVGIDIVPERRRQGYATDAYHTLLAYLFGQLRIHRVWLLVLETNTAALSLYKKIGFRKEGVLREAVFRDNRYCDYVSMSMLASEYAKR